MKITKCDKCGKIKKKEKHSKEDKWVSGWIDAGNLSFHSFDLCEKCGKPLMKYFKKYFKYGRKRISKTIR